MALLRPHAGRQAVLVRRTTASRPGGHHPPGPPAPEGCGPSRGCRTPRQRSGGLARAAAATVAGARATATTEPLPPGRTARRHLRRPGCAWVPLCPGEPTRPLTVSGAAPPGRRRPRRGRSSGGGGRPAGAPPRRRAGAATFCRPRRRTPRAAAQPGSTGRRCPPRSARSVIGSRRPRPSSPSTAGDAARHSFSTRSSSARLVSGEPPLLAGQRPLQLLSLLGQMAAGREIVPGVRAHRRRSPSRCPSPPSDTPSRRLPAGQGAGAHLFRVDGP